MGEDYNTVIMTQKALEQLDQRRFELVFEQFEMLLYSQDPLIKETINQL